VIKKAVLRGIHHLGYDVVPVDKVATPAIPPDFSEGDRAIIRRVAGYTMTSPERLGALLASIDYLVDNRIEGAIVECGVWRGGSMLAAALRLRERGDCRRTLWLYDTFEGMTPPTDLDRSVRGTDAAAIFEARKSSDDRAEWCRADRADVAKTMAMAEYPQDLIRYVQGPVEETLPAMLPGPIALLRLDTDWYQSTHHELTHLYGLVVETGVLIIDDYGHWEGCRKAVDEFFEKLTHKPLLARIDYTARLAIKTA
jgi:hypothetical protein